MRKILLAATGGALALGLLFTPHTAQAWWRGGYGHYGPRVYYGPPIIYAPPPIYYAPPPVYYAPPPFYVPPVAGQTCYAGAYICPLDQPVPIGGTCSCPTNVGRAYGRAR